MKGVSGVRVAPKCTSSSPHVSFANSRELVAEHRLSRFIRNQGDGFHILTQIRQGDVQVMVASMITTKRHATLGGP